MHWTCCSIRVSLDVVDSLRKIVDVNCYRNYQAGSFDDWCKATNFQTTSQSQQVTLLTLLSDWRERPPPPPPLFSINQILRTIFETLSRMYPGNNLVPRIADVHADLHVLH